MAVEYYSRNQNYSKEFLVQKLLSLDIYKVGDKQLYELTARELNDEFSRQMNIG
ncbi:hypothetical protein JCM19037_1064 [Geomicrobium sp. JCM 19037]|uniref:Fur-regulated basic protein FbpA n=1 Tax=unclassified Geomicrobium TaxID=2628951 RepID=UPI00045F10FB|nr:Fur-regulated basic protein FbpA [Geomicrobium sp. JCM 19037]GAK02805.1 hypothetical protein JCM19037_1064 [Geomicrobium sp. JCM 19037]